MKKFFLLIAAALSAKAAIAQNFDPKYMVTVGTKGQLESEILSNRHFVKDSAYFITGRVFVKNGAKLTIDPGTVIFGDTNGVYRGVLVITREGSIDARGTAENPIIFTSPKTPGRRKTGDWGGIVLFGKAPVNDPSGELEYDGGVLIRKSGTGDISKDTKGGGTNAGHSSGYMQYVRIEYPGYPLDVNKEINGLTMSGVGNGTTIDHIQVSYSGDDSYEWFGGTVNCKYMIAFAGQDDDFDTDNGFSGNVQFGLGLRSPRIADQSGSTGFESDNDANESTNSPQTMANFSNMTIVGPKKSSSESVNPLFTRGAHLRRNTAEGIFNSIICGYPTGITFDGTKVVTNLANNTGGPVVENCLLAGNGKLVEAVGATGVTFDAANYISSHSNNTYTESSSLMLNDSFQSQMYGNWMPKAGSPAMSGASFSNTRINTAFFDKVNYIGAFGTTDWTSKWSNFNPNTQNYTPATSGIQEIRTAVDEITIYPNPAAHAATVRFFNPSAKSLAVHVLDLTGREVYTVATRSYAYGENKLSIPVDQMTSGLYLVNITAEDGGVSTLRFSVLK